MTNHSDAPGPVERSVARRLAACTGFASAPPIEGSRESGADTKSHYPGQALLNAANWDTQETPGENKAVYSRKGTTGILKVVLEMPWRIISAWDPLRTNGRPVSSASSRVSVAPVNDNDSHRRFVHVSLPTLGSLVPCRADSR